MTTLNRVELIGFVGKDPEFRTTQRGDDVCRFSVATSDKWRDKASGQWKEDTLWHSIAVYNQSIISYLRTALSGGMYVRVEGKLAIKKWTDNYGAKQTSVEILISKFKGDVQLLAQKKDRTQDTFEEPADLPPDEDDINY